MKKWIRSVSAQSTKGYKIQPEKEMAKGGNEIDGWSVTEK